jgi:cell division septation protein DedD
MEFDREKLKAEYLKDFDDSEVEDVHQKPEIDLDSEPGIPIKLLFPLVIIVVIVAGVFAWKTGSFSFNVHDDGEVPVIKAQKDPVRIKPEEPGGMYIANRDKLIYETISNDEEKSLPKVVKILPRHEEPVEREDIQKKANEVFATLPSRLETKLIGNENEEKQAQVASSDVDSGKKEIIKKQELLANELSVEKKDNEPAKETKESITVADIKNVPTPSIRSRGVIEPKKSKNGIKVQLGSFRTEGDVQKNWRNIKKKHSSLLDGFELNTEKADLGDKGVFYRLRVGVLENESEARKLCKKLIEQNQGCFVVKK